MLPVVDKPCIQYVVEEAVAFNSAGRRLPIKRSLSLQNLFGEKAVFKLRHRAPAQNF